MTHVWTYPNGHEWAPGAGEESSSGAAASLCPTCGAEGTPGPNQTLCPDFSHADEEIPLPRSIRPAVAIAAQMLGPSTVPAEGPGTEPPAVAGYDILGILGHGGMGVVYKARDIHLNRVVALKMMLSGVHASPDERARFGTEAEAVAQLQHPNIVQVFAVGEHEGQAFLALEYVAGGSLARRLDGTPQPCHPAAELVETLAQAMHCAHERGIVHRDLKPANILLQRD